MQSSIGSTPQNLNMPAKKQINIHSAINGEFRLPVWTTSEADIEAVKK